MPKLRKQMMAGATSSGINKLMQDSHTAEAGSSKTSGHRRYTPRSCGPFGLSIPEAGAMVGLGRNASYEAAKRGKIPTLEFGALKIVPRIPWLKQIGADDPLAISNQD
jgi:hypothetical protein